MWDIKKKCGWEVGEETEERRKGVILKESGEDSL